MVASLKRLRFQSLWLSVLPSQHGNPGRAVTLSLVAAVPGTCLGQVCCGQSINGLNEEDPVFMRAFLLNRAGENEGLVAETLKTKD